jgi:hypothetical protein
VGATKSLDMSQPFDGTRDLASILRKPLLTLRIIVAALAMGPLVFAAFAIAQNAGKPHALGGPLGPLNIVLLGMGLITLVLGVVMPQIVFASGRGAAGAATPVGWTPEQRTSPSPELLRTDSILQRLQTSTIIGCALFEGGAFANVVGYLQTRELLHLVLAGILAMGTMTCFPTAGSCQRRIEDELQRIKDADAFQKMN